MRLLWWADDPWNTPPWVPTPARSRCWVRRNSSHNGDVWKPKEPGPRVTGLSEMMEEHFTLQLCEPSVNLAARAAIFVFGKQTKAREKHSAEARRFAKSFKNNCVKWFHTSPLGWGYMFSRRKCLLKTLDENLGREDDMKGPSSAGNGVGKNQWKLSGAQFLEGTNWWTNYTHNVWTGKEVPT